MSESSSQGVSAIVTAWNRWECLQRTITKLQDCQPQPKEILVHVDGGQQGLAEQIRQTFPEVKVLVSAERSGPGGARNRLIECANYPLVASFDDDSHPEDADFFQQLEKAARLFPEASVFAASIYEPGQDLPALSDFYQWVADFTGCGCAYRRGDFLKTDGYVPVPLAYGMEEIDLALRIMAARGRILKAHTLRVLHETDPGRRASADAIAASISNLAVHSWLRYPFWVLPLGIIQCLHRVCWLYARGIRGGILSGLRNIPSEIKKYRQWRKMVPAGAIWRYHWLRRNPLLALH